MQPVVGLQYLVPSVFSGSGDNDPAPSVHSQNGSSQNVSSQNVSSQIVSLSRLAQLGLFQDGSSEGCSDSFFKDLEDVFIGRVNVSASELKNWSQYGLTCEPGSGSSMPGGLGSGDGFTTMLGVGVAGLFLGVILCKHSEIYRFISSFSFATFRDFFPIETRSSQGSPSVVPAENIFLCIPERVKATLEGSDSFAKDNIIKTFTCLCSNSSKHEIQTAMGIIRQAYQRSTFGADDESGAAEDESEADEDEKKSPQVPPVSDDDLLPFVLKHVSGDQGVLLTQSCRLILRKCYLLKD